MREPDDYAGILVIGDPHLEGRVPGFRKDEYPTVILEKLAWCLQYAREHRLLPAILGDLFDKPRDNPNWMLCRLVDLLDGEVLGLYGNHDCADPVLGDHDSLSLLVKTRRLRLVSEEWVWRGRINGRRVVVGGSSYRKRIPARFDAGVHGEDSSAYVVWLTHHDIMIPGYDAGHEAPREIPGIDVVINGHIHRQLDEVETGGTVWVTPGNISRRARSDASRAHVPCALRLDVFPDGCARTYVRVPHRAFDEVFHAAIVDRPVESARSEFVTGLAELQARRTERGAGLMEFLEKNLGTYAPAVAAEIRALAQETVDGKDESA